MVMKGILTIDIGGTNVKLKHSDIDEIRKFPSGSELVPDEFARHIVELTKDWRTGAYILNRPIWAVVGLVLISRRPWVAR